MWFYFFKQSVPLSFLSYLQHNTKRIVSLGKKSSIFACVVRLEGNERFGKWEMTFEKLEFLEDKCAG